MTKYRQGFRFSLCTALVGLTIATLIVWKAKPHAERGLRSQDADRSDWMKAKGLSVSTAHLKKSGQRRFEVSADLQDGENDLLVLRRGTQVNGSTFRSGTLITILLEGKCEAGGSHTLRAFYAGGGAKTLEPNQVLYEEYVSPFRWVADYSREEALFGRLAVLERSKTWLRARVTLQVSLLEALQGGEHRVSGIDQEVVFELE